MKLATTLTETEVAVPLKNHQNLHEQLVMIQLVLWRHPAGIKHYDLPAKVVITYRQTDTFCKC